MDHGEQRRATPPPEADAAQGSVMYGEINPAIDAGIEERIRRIEWFADLMDTRFRIPVINYPIGLDGIVGLIPGVGDTVTAVASVWLVNEAWRLGARRRTLARMGLNVGVDWAIGLIPLVGEIFDFAHKANAKNARLLAADLRARGVDVRSRFGEDVAAASDLLGPEREG